jgi:hypothetical protein
MLDLRLAIPWYPPGSPCWVDLLVPDIGRAQEFYAQLFGWEWRRGDALTGGYTLALLDGQPVAGISRKPPAAKVANQWTTYLRVVDLTSTGWAIREHGGRLLGRPARLGRLASTQIVQCPGGAYFGLWEPEELPGCGLLDQPGALTWNELMAHDFEGAARFHASIFGHEFTEHSDPDGPRWATAHLGDGNPAFGLSQIGWEWPVDIPPHWVTSFATSHVVPTLAKALDLGATLLHGPFDGPYGMGALLRGVEDEVFAILVPDLD